MMQITMDNSPSRDATLHVWLLEKGLPFKRGGGVEHNICGCVRVRVHACVRASCRHLDNLSRGDFFGETGHPLFQGLYQPMRLSKFASNMHHAPI